MLNLLSRAVLAALCAAAVAAALGGCENSNVSEPPESNTIAELVSFDVDAGQIDVCAVLRDVPGYEDRLRDAFALGEPDPVLRTRVVW